MRRQGIIFLLWGLLLGALAALWWWLRVTGWIDGPDEPLAEILATILPVLFLVFGWQALAAAHHDELPGKTPRRLAHRLAALSGEESRRGLAVIFLVVTTIAFVLAFSFVVSLYPKTWGESWECHDCSDGEGTCCDLVEGSAWYQNVLSIACMIVIPLWAIGGPAAGLLGLRFLRRRAAVPLPVLEASARSLVPGSQLDLLLVVHGDRVFRSLSLRVECEEAATYDAGSSSSTDTDLVHRAVLVESGAFQLPRGQPLELTRSWSVPRDAMHSFRSSNNEVRWRIVVELGAGSTFLSESYDLRILSAPSASP